MNHFQRFALAAAPHAASVTDYCDHAEHDEHVEADWVVGAGAALDETRRALAGALGEDDGDHVFLELVALSWFPFAHSGTLVAALGFDGRDPAFVNRHGERNRPPVCTRV